MSERKALTPVCLSSPFFLKTLATFQQANWITAAYHGQRQVFPEYKPVVVLPSRDSVKVPNLILSNKCYHGPSSVSAFSGGSALHRLSVWSGSRVYWEDVLQGKYDVNMITLRVCMRCMFIFDKFTHVDWWPLGNSCCWWWMSFSRHIWLFFVFFLFTLFDNHFQKCWHLLL